MNSINKIFKMNKIRGAERKSARHISVYGEVFFLKGNEEVCHFMIFYEISSLAMIPARVRSFSSATSACLSFGTLSSGPLPGGLPCHLKSRSNTSTPLEAIV